MIGQTISHYRILGKLGEGGMGVVYKAEDTKLGRTIALKFLAPHLVRDPEARQRFEREARAAAALDHPNICTVFEVDEAEDKTFIALAFLDGHPLSKKIGEGPLKLAEALSIGMQLAEGLGAAHAKGVVHRDLKPDNVMLLEGSRGLVKILDFGLAQLAGTSKLTQGGTTLGTMSYMSPEQAEGGEVDYRADIWALGIILYEMVAGRPPFRGDFDQAVVYSILNEAPEALSAVRTGVPQELERIVNKCLAKQADQRYQHTEDLLVDLTALRNQLDQSQRAPDRPTDSRRPTMWALGAAAITVLIALGLWVLLPKSWEAPAPPEYTFTQITRDTGYSGQPTLSLDGRLLAYASDRAGAGNLDIWVQQLGEATRFGSPKIQPTRTPLRSLPTATASSSARTGTLTGIYVVPALGGAERRIADSGQNPRFSPDGNWISYYRREVADGNEVFSTAYVTAASGGPPRPIETNLALFAPAVWSPNGQHLLGLGSVAPGEVWRASQGLGWSLVPVEGGEAIRVKDFVLPRSSSSARSLARRAGSWMADGDWFVFDDDAGGPRNLWRARISAREGRLIGEPQRLTAGTGEQQPSASMDGKIAFVSVTRDQHIWSLPLDANRAQVEAVPQKVTSGLSKDTFPSTSADGRRLVYTSDRAGNRDIWLRDLQTGQDKPLTVTPEHEFRGVISPDGTRVAFARSEDEQLKVYVLEIDRGVERVLVENIGSHTSWTPDGAAVLYYTTSPIRWKTINVDTGSEHDLALEHSEFPVHSAQLSPDQQWVSLKLQGSPGTQLFVSPMIDGQAADETRWVSIGAAGSLEGGHNWWSLDGNTIYYKSAQDGFACIVAQRLDPETKAPQGPPLDVQHFHNRLQPDVSSTLGLAITTDRLYLPLGETKASVWLAVPQPAE